MSIDIKFRELWTYNITISPKERKESEKKMPIDYLSEKEYTHIHGELQIIINGRIVPRMGIDSPDDVCIGYWIEMLTNLVSVLKTEIQTYTVEGGDQGKPAYKFDKEGDNIYLSIVDSMLGGKGDPNWQRVQFSFTDFKAAFNRFKENILNEIGSKCPSMLEAWSNKFQTERSKNRRC